MKTKLEILRDLRMKIDGLYNEDERLYTVMALPNKRYENTRQTFHIKARSSYFAMHVARVKLREWCLQNGKLVADYDLFLVAVGSLP